MKSLYKTAWAAALFFTFGLLASACGEAPKSEDESQTEQTEAIEATEADTAATHEEHPADGEHPSEHPGDSDEHPTENEHPN